MDGRGAAKRDTSPTPEPSHRRAPSNSGLLSKFPFMRSAADTNTQDEEQQQQQQQHQSDQHAEQGDAQNETQLPPPGRSLAAVTQQQKKTRRRRGSLRKVALLGRGAQRDSRALTIDTSRPATTPAEAALAMATKTMTAESEALKLDLSDVTPRQSVGARASETGPASASASSGAVTPPVDRDGDPSNSYTSTTDEEDLLQLPRGGTATTRAGLSTSSGSESYFPNVVSSVPRPRPFQQTKSPLSYSGLNKTPLPPPDADWDYAETEWWGWVVLGVTWFVFVVGMGSCLDVWSWAWDVGKTPYAPPELEDDPTLPIVGYYPALIILTGVMAWVWVVVAWVGMKYFRHAKISGD